LAQRYISTNEGAELAPLTHAPSAASGVACGEIVLDEARACERTRAGAPVVLVRHDAETRDIRALDLAQGLLTQRGARTSHAAVVARQLGKVCLVGCEALQIDNATRSIRLGDITLREGDFLTLDGNSGAIYAGRTRIVERVPSDLIERLQALRAAHCA
ncbi:MAG TPA: PEP-utilizing enzyme, partial [Steroidobacteraceae bacterium]|nr:PEP-utilizing enzyme [Steroidobacteraceae bacterium]